jgi:ubiquinone/menaquinone biosynthesis C-methylase UbiE
MRDRLGKFLVDWRVKTILPYVKGDLLDIGCGTNKLAKKHRQGVGVDVYQWGDVDLVVKDTSKLPYDDESFDTITIIATLNHIPNRENVLNEARRLLRRDGIILITMIPPRFSQVWHFLRKPWDADQKERGMKEGEVFGFRKEEIRKMLINAGFEIIMEKPFMFYINKITIAKKAGNFDTESVAP